MYGCQICSKTACLVLNGEINDYELFKQNLENNKYEIIIAVDGGTRHLYNVDVVPDIVVGDLDSISEKMYNYCITNMVEIEKYPTKKNETDMELAILKAIECNAMCIDIYAATGKRTDHVLANIQMMYNILKKGLYSRIISEDEVIYILENEELTLEGNVGDIISVIPVNGDAKGITLRNLEYPLEEYDMEYGVSRGISNVMTDEVCYIDVRDGCLLVVKNKGEDTVMKGEGNE